VKIIEKPLLLNLSDNYQIQAQTNTVFVQQKEMDWGVGLVEPTTSASFFLSFLPECVTEVAVLIFCSGVLGSISTNNIYYLPSHEK
jgi:hypothetical protein